MVSEGYQGYHAGALISEPFTCQEDFGKVKKGKTEEVHKDKSSWDAFVESFKD